MKKLIKLLKLNTNLSFAKSRLNIQLKSNNPNQLLIANWKLSIKILEQEIKEFKK